jgi:EDD domain protein, DegV family
MGLKIVVDSSIGFSKEEAVARGLSFIPLSVTLGDRTYLEGVDITCEEFYRLLDQGFFPKTSQPSPKLYMEAFNEAAKNGDNVLLLSISSKVSGSFQAANLARSMCSHPEQIFIFDTLSFFGGIQIILSEVEARAEEPIAALLAYLEDLKTRIRVYAGMDTLTYVYKGGRLTKFSLALGIFLHAKAIGMLDEGNVVLAGKAIGTKNAMKFVVDKTKENEIDFSYPCYLLYSSDRDILDRFASEYFYPAYPSRKPLPVIRIDPLIGSHIGPLVYGVFYVSVEKDETKRSLLAGLREKLLNKLRPAKKTKSE